MKMLMKMLLVTVMMIAGQDSVGWHRRRGVAAWSDNRKALTLRLGLGQHGDGDYYKMMVLIVMTSILVMVFMRLHGQIIARP